MKPSSSEDLSSGISTKRIETLIDGIFAIAMTLLVLNLEIVSVGRGGVQVNLHKLLISQKTQFINYGQSFILLAVFWIIQHKHFHYIKRTDQVHLWINIVYLMFVVLIPFSTSLLNDYSNDPMATLFFSLNLFLIGVLSALSWSYATRKHRLIDRDIDSRIIVIANRRGLVTPFVSFAAIIASLLHINWAAWFYIFIPIFLFLPQFYYKAIEKKNK